MDQMVLATQTWLNTTYNGVNGYTPFSEEELEIRLFMDESSVEIFVNDGLEVFTARIYSQADHNHVQFFADGQASVTATQWEI